MSENNRKSTPQGRPPALDEFQRGQACGMIILGATRREIANVLKVHPSTIARTAERDEKFASELEEAETLCRLRPLKKMYLAMESHWRAAAWMLERLHPDQFGRRKGVTYSQREVREVIDRLLESVYQKVPAEADREELRLVADRLCEEVGKMPPRNPLVEMEKQMDELRAYQRERNDREAAKRFKGDWGYYPSVGLGDDPDEPPPQKPR